jgi:serine/threonine protein kinase
MDRPYLIGTTLGAYEIQALIGAGGMASVYRGFDPNLRRSVAIKVLSAAFECPHYSDAPVIAGSVSVKVAP